MNTTTRRGAIATALGTALAGTTATVAAASTRGVPISPRPPSLRRVRNRLDRIATRLQVGRVTDSRETQRLQREVADLARTVAELAAFLDPERPAIR